MSTSEESKAKLLQLKIAGIRPNDKVLIKNRNVPDGVMATVKEARGKSIQVRYDSDGIVNTISTDRILEVFLEHS